LIGTNWEALTGDAARPPLDALAALLHRTGDEALLRRIDAGISAVRARPLACYPAWTLCEARVSGDGTPGALPFLSGDRGVVLLSGENDPVFALNRAIGLQLTGEAAFLDYWLLFCSAVRGEDGRFQVIESPDQIAWRDAIDPARAAEVRARVDPPRMRSCDAEAAEFTGCVVYGGTLFAARFKVHADGRVEMLSDEAIAEQPVARAERFDGPIRGWADDA